MNFIKENSICTFCLLHNNPQNTTVIFNTDEVSQSTTAATPSAGSSKEETIPSVVSAEAKSKAKNTKNQKVFLSIPAFIFAC